jgi:hypothetical protein
MMIEFYKMKQPSTLVSIDQYGKIHIFWDAIEEKAKEYKPQGYNETNTAWAYVLIKVRDES